MMTRATMQRMILNVSRDSRNSMEPKGGADLPSLHIHVVRYGLIIETLLR